MFFNAWRALIFFGAAPDFFVALEAADLPTPALLPTAALVVACAGTDLFAFTDPVDDGARGFFAGDALAALPGPVFLAAVLLATVLLATVLLATVLLATFLLTTFFLTTALRATVLPAGVLLAADAVVLPATFFAATLVAPFVAVVLAAGLPLVLLLPATFLLAAFLVAMLDSRSIGPLKQRRHLDNTTGMQDR